MRFSWYGVKPEMALALAGLPIVELEELEEEDPRDMRVDVGPVCVEVVRAGDGERPVWIWE